MKPEDPCRDPASEARDDWYELEEKAKIMTPEQNKVGQQLRTLILDTIDSVGSYESAKGWLRYEKMRTLNIQQLSQLQRRNLEGENFDDMIDSLITKDITE